MAALNEAAIAIAARLWQTTALTQAKIAKAAGVRPPTISRWIEAGILGERPGAPAARKRSFTRRRAGKAIAERIYRIINTKLEQMEEGMANGTLAPTDVERYAKSVASMVGGFDKALPAKPNERKKRKPKPGDSGDAAVSEVERLQREIIERFERIQQRRQSEEGSK